MHWLITLTAIASTASLCAAVPGRTPINRLLRREDPLCPSDSEQCFGASSSTDCKGCEETCFSLNEAGDLCKASCIVSISAGVVPITTCSCDRKCKRGKNPLSDFDG
jgi:hypothetical protein